MHQVKRMHRTLVVLAVGLLALAAPLVACERRRPEARLDGEVMTVLAKARPTGLRASHASTRAALR